MSHARRRFLKTGVAALLAALAPRSYAMQVVTSRDPIQEILSEWDELGWKWTGTDVELASAQWLARSASAAGLDVAIERYPFERVDVSQCQVYVGDQRAAGLPLFDGGSTPSTGVAGALTAAGEDGDIAVLELAPWEADAESLRSARADSRYSAVIVVTRGSSAGLAPLDCKNPLHEKPLAKPVVQVGSEHRDWLLAAATAHTSGQAIAKFERSPAEGRNVVAVWSGLNQKLAPLVVLLGRSGWGPCVGERGGSLVCMLQAAEALSRAAAARTVIFAATSGCELGNMGAAAFLARYPELARQTFGWMQLGANLGARGSALEISGQNQDWTRVIEARLNIEGVRWRIPPVASTDDGANSSTPPAPVETPAPPSQPAIVQGLLMQGSPAAPFHLPADLLPIAVDLSQIRALSRGFTATLLELSAA